MQAMNEPQKKEELGFFGYLVLGLLGLVCTHVIIGRLLSVIPSDRESIKSSVIGVNVTSPYWIGDIFLGIFGLLFAIAIVGVCFRFLHRWYKAIPAILMVYAVVAAPSMHSWYTANYKTPKIGKTNTDLQTLGQGVVTEIK
jgi:hypothetical protein